MYKKGIEVIKCIGCILGITLIAGILLGTVYGITKEPIAKADKAEFDKACKEVFAGDDYTFNESTVDGEAVKGALVNYDKISIDAIYDVSKAGTKAGSILLVTTKEGYGGDISILVGMNEEGVIKGVSIASISETPGLGMNAKDVLVPQFKEVKGTFFTVTKTGKKRNDEIDAISGATVTSNAITKAVNAAVAYMTEVGGGTE